MSDPAPLPKPILLGQGHVTQAMADLRFFELLPEFRPLQAKQQAAMADLQQRRGCSGCQKRRAAQNIFGDFLSTMLALSPDGLARIKQYFGAPTLMLNVMDPQTRQVQLKVL